MNKFTWYLYSPLFSLKWHKIYDRKIRSCHKFAAYSWRSCQTSLANLFTGDETSVHYIEPKSKSSYKTLASKKVKRSRIAEGFQTVRKIWYVIFFYNKDPVMQIWQKGKTVKGTFFINGFIKNLKIFFLQKSSSQNGYKVSLAFAKNVPAPKARTYLEAVKVTALPNLQFSPDFALCDFLLLFSLKFHLFRKDKNYKMPLDLQFAFITIWKASLLRSIKMFPEMDWSSKKV